MRARLDADGVANDLLPGVHSKQNRPNNRSWSFGCVTDEDRNSPPGRMTVLKRCGISHFKATAFKTRGGQSQDLTRFSKHLRESLFQQPRARRVLTMS
jgi:hypothetical protein